VNARKREKKPRLDKSQSLTPRELELVALFKVMTEPDRRLLLSMARKLISTQTEAGSRKP
jgi:hypothetical protein